MAIARERESLRLRILYAFFELAILIAIGIVVGVGVFYQIYPIPLATNATQILTSLISINGIIIGFASVIISLRYAPNVQHSDPFSITKLIVAGILWGTSLMLCLIKLSYLEGTRVSSDVFLQPIVLFTAGLFCLLGFLLRGYVFPNL